MNIEDPVISRKLAIALQWMPLKKRQAILTKVGQLESARDLDEYLASVKATGAAGDAAAD